MSADNNAARPAEDKSEARERFFETLSGALLAIFAAVLAFADLGGGNVAEDRELADNAQASDYSWYQSKGIKQQLAESEASLIESLIAAGSIAPQQKAALEARAAQLSEKAGRYGKEKEEILKGSAAVGEANWVQDVAGELGQLVGADVYKARVEALNGVDNIFDKSGLYLQLCLVIGALSLLFRVPALRLAFLAATLALGLAGCWYTLQGYSAYARLG